MKTVAGKITEFTLIPLSLVITVVAGAVWISDVRSATDTNRADIQRIDKDLEILRTMDGRLSHIEGELVFLRKRHRGD